MATTATQNFAFEVDGLSATLDVLRFHGNEALSELFRFEIDLASDERDLEWDDTVGKAAVLVLPLEDGERRIHGIVTSFEECGQSPKKTFYTATLEPKLWLLTQRRQCRIFQAKATPDILKTVFTGVGISGEAVEFRLQGDYGPRSFCVQYRETDYDFAQRLMEEEGIAYHFEHGDDQSVLVISDHVEARKEIEGESTLQHRDPDAAVGETESVMGFACARTFRPGAVVLRDYDFKHPALSLEGHYEDGGDRETAIELYDFPGEFHDTSLGSSLAQSRLEEERAESWLASAESNCRRFTPGGLFTLEGHWREDLHQQYLIVRVAHRGRTTFDVSDNTGGLKTGETYRNTFECIPADVCWRPPRLTPRPVIEGSQSAIVTGPKGEEIHCDEFGRVKVRFHWDRTDPKDDTSSCWVRASQVWGGAGYGGMFVPRVGTEVLVDFFDGDPDRPIITGRIYHGEHGLPFQLPGAKTKTTIQSMTTPGGGGANEITFEDQAGVEEVYMHASKDLDAKTHNNKDVEVKEEVKLSIGKDRKIHIGLDKTTTIKGNRGITIGGNHFGFIHGKRDLKVDGAETTNIGAVRVIGVKKDFKVNVKGDESSAVPVMALVGKADVEESVDGAFTEMVGGVLFIKTKADYEEKVEKVRGLATAFLKKKTSADFKLEVKGSASFSGAKMEIKGSDITIEASKIILLAGDAEIALADGNITIKAKEISVKDDGDSTVKGSTIGEN